MNIRNKIKEIRKKLKERYIDRKYRIAYGTFRSSNLSSKLGFLLVYLEEVGVKELKEETHWVNITFNDDTTVRFWNANRWFAWMFQGSANFSNGKKYEWKDFQPSYEILFKYKKLVTSITDTNTDFSEFLPIKLQRKIKLNKLK